MQVEFDEDKLWQHFSSVSVPAILRWQVRCCDNEDEDNNILPSLFDTILKVALTSHISEVISTKGSVTH